MRLLIGFSRYSRTEGGKDSALAVSDINDSAQRFSSDSLAADLLGQVRWRDGVKCPRCRPDLAVRNGTYIMFQRPLYKNFDRTFNEETATIFAHSKVALRKRLFSIYAFLRFNTSLRQLQREIVACKRMHRRVERFTRALDAPSLNLIGPVEIDELYISA